MIILLISRYFHPLFQIPIIPRWLSQTIGIVLILVGVPFFIISVKTVTKAYNSEVLVIQGIYRCCRHPLYSAWVIFIVPGFVFLADSWIGMSIPLFMYFLLKKLVVQEEDYLERVFGSIYIEYKNKIPAIVPYGFLLNKE